MTCGAVLTKRIPALLYYARVGVCTAMPANLNRSNVCRDRLKVLRVQTIPPRHRGARHAVPQNTAETAVRILDHSQVRGPREQPGRRSAVTTPGDPVT